MDSYHSTTKVDKCRLCYVSASYRHPELVFDRSLINNESIRYIIDYLRKNFTRKFIFFTSAFADHPMRNHLAMIGLKVNSFKVRLTIDDVNIINQDRKGLLEFLTDGRYVDTHLYANNFFDAYILIKANYVTVYNETERFCFNEEPNLRAIKILVDLLSETKSFDILRDIKLADLLTMTI